jgi:hypothetical protein
MMAQRVAIRPDPVVEMPALLRAWSTTAFTPQLKAVIPPATTTDPGWAGPFTRPNELAAGFLALLQRASAIGRLASTPVPWNTPMMSQISGASCKWVGEGTPKPATKVGLTTTTLIPKKASAIVAVTKELLNISTPGAAEALQALLVRELTAFVDAAFLSTAAASAIQPAGILAGVTASTDVADVLSDFFAARPHALTPTWIMSPAAVSKQSPGWDIYPGTFRGFPVVVSAAAGANVILVDAAAVAVADAGVDLDLSEHATIELVDAPVAPLATTVQTSFWQNNLVGIRVERLINWTVAAGAVAYFTQA